MANYRFSEQWAISGTIDPDAYASGTYSTDVIDLEDVHEVVFIVQVGTMAATSTVDFIAREMTASGTGTTTVAGGAGSITQLTQAGTDSDKQVIVQVRADTVSNRWIKGVMTVGTAASDAGVLVLTRRRYSPASDHDLATVDEIVTNS